MDEKRFKLFSESYLIIAEAYYEEKYGLKLSGSEVVLADEPEKQEKQAS